VGVGGVRTYVCFNEEVKKMIAKIILAWVQPLTVILFLISGTCCFLIKPAQLNQGVINYLLGAVNFFIFYGSKFFK